MKIAKILLLSLLLLAPLAFTACDNGNPEINIEMETDYREIIKAIGDTKQSLSNKMALIEAAVRNGLAENQSLLELMQEAVSSLGGTLEEKLAAIETAMQMRTTALETKLALVEAAVNNGFADSKKQQELLQQAVAAMGGTLENKLSAIDSAVTSKTTGLETKIGLVEAAVQKGFADDAAAQALIVEAIEALDGTLEEKIAAVEAVVGSRTADLAAKLALIETAVKEGFAGQQTAQDLIRKAVETLGGTLEAQLTAIETALKSQTTSLETKLALIEEALKDNTSDTEGELDLIRKALVSLDETMSGRLSAIESAMKSRTPSLETKFELIATAVEEGFMADTAAVHAVHTALDSSLYVADTALVNLKDSILVQLTAIAARLTPDELAKALTDIVSAIDSQTQSSAAVLAAIKQTVDDLVDSQSGSYALFYAGDPKATITVTKGEAFSVKLRVEPAEAVLIRDSLQIDVVSRKLFYPEGASTGTEPDHFTLQSVVKDPAVAGQYDVTIATNSTVSVWDESILAIVYRFGKPDHPKHVTTETFPVIMMPRAKDALVGGYYPNAAFQMRDTIIAHENKVTVDTMGVIYYALGSVNFRTEDRKESRTYTAGNLSAAHFVQPDKPDTASVFTRLDADKHFVSFYPDTTRNQAWRDFKSRFADDHESQTVSGKLALTDRWGATDSLDLAMKWYVAWTISYEIVDTTSLMSLKPSDFEYTGQTYVRKYPEIWSQRLAPWGLDYETIRRCGLELENTPKGCGSNFKLMQLNLSSGPSSTCLEVAEDLKPVKGNEYQALGVFRLCVRPSDVDPSFCPTQILYKYQITLKVTQEDDTH